MQFDNFRAFTCFLRDVITRNFATQHVIRRDVAYHFAFGGNTVKGNNRNFCLVSHLHSITNGIRVSKIKIIVYSLCGLLASLAGIIEVARLSSAQPTAGTGYELDAIAAVVLGGTSLAGGKGRIVGTLIGALILGFLNNGLNLLGVSSYYQYRQQNHHRFDDHLVIGGYT